MLVNIAQSAGLTSDANPLISAKEAKQNVEPDSLATAGNRSRVAEDRITLSPPSQQSVVDAKKSEIRKEEAKVPDKAGKSEQGMADVQFVYDKNGELTVRYQDKANNLIYQVPSDFLLKMKEAASKSETSVDTKA